MTINQIGRELTRRLVEKTGCELQTAIRFFYNSELYGKLDVSNLMSLDELYANFEGEFIGAK